MIKQAIQSAVFKLKPNSGSPLVDAYCLLSFVMDKDKSWFMAYPEHCLSADQGRRFNRLVDRRAQGVPIAYLIGTRDFWDISLQTSPHTLIPRPETETLLEWALESLPEQASVLELGTGTGAIALALANTKPQWKILATDFKQLCLDCAQTNARHNGIEGVVFLKSDWFDQLPAQQRFDVILSNPPYIAKDDPHLQQGDVRFEPQSALVSGRDGLDAIRHIIKNAPRFLLPGGLLMLEHGWTHADAVRQLMQAQGFKNLAMRKDLSGQPRVSCGRRP